MARPGFMAILMAGIVLPAVALHPAKLLAQAPSAAPSRVLSYDDLSAAEKRTAAQKEATSAQHGKKDKQAEAAPTEASATAAVAPAGAAGASVDTAGATDAAAPAAVAAEADETADGTVPKVAPKMQRTMFGKMKPVKEKAPKLVPVTIVHGELTVDGLIAKAGLNFQIPDMRFFYIWVPGLGTTIVSNQPFPGSHIQESALDGLLLDREG